MERRIKEKNVEGRKWKEEEKGKKRKKERERTFNKAK